MKMKSWLDGLEYMRLTQTFESREIKIGSYGICTHPNWQRRRVASRVSAEAMKKIIEIGCAVAFLSVDVSNTASVNLHSKNGFVILSREFSWTNSKGETRKDIGWMLVLVNSQELYELILNSLDILYVGKGYW